ncbi:MAG: RES family NAD+ phosphorylase [Actinomycetota bacterium]|nr:RES family NAD+ phosphorylase [Actinomycetota bacterium]
MDADISIEDDLTLWRVHPTLGDHVVAWDELRYWGPAETMRFDPHLPPPRVQDRGVLYAGLAIPDVLAEVYQQTRVVDRASNGTYLTGWQPARPLRLLDLAGTWPIRAGASYAINSGRKDHCRLWARTIHTARPDLDGLWHHSSMTGGTLVTLLTHAADSFPTRPAFDMPLNHRGLHLPLLDACKTIGYRLV